MTIVVETGTGAAASNAYASMDTVADYCVTRGLAFATSPSAPGEQAIIRATAALDATYRSQFPGTRTKGRTQGLEWPRTNATDVDGDSIAIDEIPIEIVNASCEMAVREFASPGSMMPDFDRGGAIKKIKAGSVEVEYGMNATPGTVFTIIDGILSSLIGSTKSGAQYVARAVRG